MKKYIGTKLIEAEKAFKIGDKIYSNENGEINKIPLNDGEVAVMGYKVRYADGYESFSPKDVFEKAYMPMEPNKKLKTDAPSISQQMVDDFIVDITADTMGSKTTVVKAILANGFEIVESSSCVSAENYDEELGAEICIDKIKDKVWYLLGFLLQTAVNGVCIPRMVEPVRDLEQEYENQVEQEKECSGCSDAEEVCRSTDAEAYDCGDGNCCCDEDAGNETIDMIFTKDSPDEKNFRKTVGLMLSDNFKDRAKAEYHQLAIRCEKLEAMCEKYAAGELDFTPNCSLELLQEQLGYMLKYKGVLEQRAKIEEIDLEDNEISKGEGIWALVTIGDEKGSMEGNSEKLVQVLLEGLEIKFGKLEEISNSFECDKDCTDCCNDGSPKE